MTTAWQSGKSGGSFVSDEARRNVPIYQEVYTVPLFSRAEVDAELAAERERWIGICKEHASDTNPPHKPHENTYGDGWLDACNEIMWAGEKA